MKVRSFCWFALVMMVLIASDAPAQQPGEEGAAAPPPSQPSDADSRLYVFENNLGIAVPTYGNPAGVEVGVIDAALRSQLNLADDVGVVVQSITADSDAAKAGLKQHDIVLKIDDTPITSPDKFNEMLKGEPDKKLSISAMREGKPLTLEIALTKPLVFSVQLRPFGDNLTVTTHVHPPSYRIGVTLAEADDTLRSQLKLAAGEGLVVTEVVPDSPAAKAGIQQHDVLIKLDGKRLSTVENINAQIQELKDRGVTLAFLRAGEEQTCEVAAQLNESTSSTGVVRYWDYSNYRLGVSGAFAPYTLGVSGANLPTVGFAPTGMLGPLTRNPQVQWPPTPAAPQAVADQLAALKKQLAEMQKALESLETTLQAPAPNPDTPEK